ncbi:MAG: hypothetical protein ACI92O_002314 [Colwellia sp.]
MCGVAFLFSPKVRAFSDETLESYLLRVVSENFFDSYEQLSLAIREALHELDFDAHGAFPIDLKRLNVYHAKHNSHFRMRAIGLLETLLDLPRFELQKLALLKSDKKFNSSVAVHRDGIDIPLKFIRSNGADGECSLPICPQCLAEEPYIKQSWHIRWINICTKHKCTLIHQCPDCNLPINYIENESIAHCLCGFDLASATNSNTTSITVKRKDAELIHNLLNNETLIDNPLFRETTISQRFAALLWYQERYSCIDNFCLNDAATFFSKWPENLYNELDHLSKNANMKLIEMFNKTIFRFIFGEVILSVPHSIQREGQRHFIRIALIDYLIRLVANNPKSKKPNVADMLVSVTEVAIILGTSHEQVYRLYQDGILQNAFRQKMNSRIDPHTGVFFLRQVIEYKSSFGDDKPKMHLSAW